MDHPKDDAEPMSDEIDVDTKCVCRPYEPCSYHADGANEMKDEIRRLRAEVERLKERDATMTKQRNVAVTKSADRAAEVERLKAKADNLTRQTQCQAQEARTEKSIVLEILHGLGLPMKDWEAVSNVVGYVKGIQAKLTAHEEAMRGAIIQLNKHCEGRGAERILRARLEAR